jgi:hypothetical protein
MDYTELYARRHITIAVRTLNPTFIIMFPEEFG